MNIKIFMSMYTRLLLFQVLNLAKGIQHIIKHADPSIWPPLRKCESSQNYIFVCLFVCLFWPGKILKFRIDIVTQIEDLERQLTLNVMSQ